MHYLLPLSALGGSILLLGADIIGRVIASPAELEVGIITAILERQSLFILLER